MTKIYSKIDGILDKRLVNIGNSVKQGDLLAVISAPLIDADKTMAQKSLTEAKFKQTFAHDTYTRYKMHTKKVQFHHKKCRIKKQITKLRKWNIILHKQV